ncbi:hypothetical protein DICPUDRAFT_159717 [Dictyostelium purpureum]|uniref:Uncharacterized protein n=1 Tax=Dictyostelium purpureum TaxID=5786 RepID=F1A4T8_DICPU|nr:uncharacterized protein DICPUDRAFT_159717 [Dictyostelium purpureum]EGC28797.1 hypothetical protein DICPUDRAFT_159717 [Dictyostelium purpureum]|eukprot:XP_003294682.1 hypothetical protein DICPUDRAFT_159717 [Dictyostelium purpureum]
MEEYNKKLKILDPYAKPIPLDTSDNNEDPMQFFLKMERLNAMEQRKAELRAQMEKDKNNNNNNNNNNNSNDQSK